MSSAAFRRTADFGYLDTSLTGFSNERLAAAIGADLRRIHADVADASQPDHLLRLAQLIDERVQAALIRD